MIFGTQNLTTYDVANRTLPQTSDRESEKGKSEKAIPTRKRSNFLTS